MSERPKPSDAPAGLQCRWTVNPVWFKEELTHARTLKNHTRRGARRSWAVDRAVRRPGSPAASSGNSGAGGTGTGQTARARGDQHRDGPSGCVLWPGGHHQRRGRADSFEVGVLGRSAPRGRRRGREARSDGCAGPGADDSVPGRAPRLRDRDGRARQVRPGGNRAKGEGLQVGSPGRRRCEVQRTARVAGHLRDQREVRGPGQAAPAAAERGRRGVPEGDAAGRSRLRGAAARRGRVERRDCRQERRRAAEGVHRHGSVLEAEESGADALGAERAQGSRGGAGGDRRREVGRSQSARGHGRAGVRPVPRRLPRAI